jgi:hypothetical protein
MPFREIPAPKFRKVSGTRSPPRNDDRYMIQLRNGFADEENRYTVKELRWLHDGSPGDIVAIRRFDRFGKEKK